MDALASDVHDTSPGSLYCSGDLAFWIELYKLNAILIVSSK